MNNKKLVRPTPERIGQWLESARRGLETTIHGLAIIPHHTRGLIIAREGIAAYLAARAVLRTFDPEYTRELDLAFDRGYQLYRKNAGSNLPETASEILV
jgi:hypothetical protein